MSNRNKVALVALAGVAAVGAGKASEQLIRRTARRRKKSKLQAWYLSKSKEVEEYADLEVDRYIIGLRQPADGTPALDLSRRDERWLREKARQLVLANGHAQLTRAFGIRLYDFDTKQAYLEQCRVRAMMFEASELADAIGAKGYPTDSLLLHPDTEPPD